MRWGVFLLVLLDCCSVFRCNLREFFVIDKQMYWRKARKYCRENHSDLATVYDMKDLQEIKNVRCSHWIGLKSNCGKENRRWHWSLPGVKDTAENWRKDQPDDNGKTNCAFMENEVLAVKSCHEKLHFSCYNESQNSSILVEKEYDWTKAQEYCRQHHTDLVSGNEQLKNATHNGKYWIGLFRDSWSWSDGSNFSFRNWKSSPSKSKSCAVLLPCGKWRSENCDDNNPFICYEDKTVLIKENKTWEDSLDFCRKHYDDLVSITNPEDQKWVQIKARNASSSHVWLGLRYTCMLQFWFWVSDEVVKYDNWKRDGKMDGCDMSGAMETGGQHRWIRHSDTEKFNFICSKS